MAHFVGIDAIDLTKLLYVPLGPLGEAGGSLKLLYLCDEKLSWELVGCCA